MWDDLQQFFMIPLLTDVHANTIAANMNVMSFSTFHSCPFPAMF